MVKPKIGEEIRIVGNRLLPTVIGHVTKTAHTVPEGKGQATQITCNAEGQSITTIESDLACPELSITISEPR